MSDEAIAAAELVAGEGSPNVEAPAAPPGGEPDPMLAKMFDGIVQDSGAVAEKPAEAEAKPEEAEEAEPEFDDLSDDRPWTPERIKNAANVLRTDKRKVGALLNQLSSREKKFKGRLEQFKNQKQQVDLIERRVMGDLETLRVGTAEQAIAALARLGQRDPHSMYEQISLAMLGKAPQNKADPIIAELKAEVAALKAATENREKNHGEAQHAGQVRNQIREVLSSDREWPTLASIAAKDPEQAAWEFEQAYVRQSKDAGRWLDVDSVADRIERTLRRKSMPSSRATNGTPGSGPDREQETRASANPETAQSPPRSLSPSLSATSGGARRTPTEEERTEEFARSAPPEFFQQFGF